MKFRVPKLKIQSILATSAALAIVCSYEACSPMKSTFENDNAAADICSSMYDPPTSLTSKATADSEKKILTLFEEKKVHLDTQVSGKAATLQNTNIVVDIDLGCAPAPGSLSANVLAQNQDMPLHSSVRQAFDYRVEEEIGVAEITALAESDKCVEGVSYPGTLKATALMLPSSSDSSLNLQSPLASSNYAHAYEHIVKKSNGTKTKVAFVDTGVLCSHTDLSANIASGCGVDMTGSGSVADVDGHGTHTFGIVGAVSNNSKGILGIAGNTATMTAIKVIHQGTGSGTAAANGIQHAIDNNMDVINISLEADQRITEVESRIQTAVNAGIVVVIAAGNSGGKIGLTSPSIIVSPGIIGASVNGAITVTSVNADSSLLSYFSNYGSFAEIAAPGSVINSKDMSKAGVYSTSAGGAYTRMMGTSQAAPVVAGAAALLIQFFRQNGVSYTPAKIEEIIKASADVNPKVNVQGNRVLNFSKLTRNAYAVAGIDLCKKPTEAGQ